MIDEAYQSFRGIFPKVPYITEDNIRAVLNVADHPKAATADPKEFFDNRFLKEIEDSGFVQELMVENSWRKKGAPDAQRLDSRSGPLVVFLAALSTSRRQIRPN